MPFWVWLKPTTLVAAGAADAAELPIAVPNAKKPISTRRFIPSFS
jgi:hypothetical protein